MPTHILSEALDLTSAALDPAAYTVRQRVICAGWSQNGRYYDERVLRAAAPLLDGVRTFADHDPRSRSVRHLTGYLRDPEYRDGALWATRHVIGEARGWLWALIVEVIEKRAPDLIGCSINAVGSGRAGEIDGTKGLIVESIHTFDSVDDVVAPSAGGTFTPLVAGGESLTASLLAALSYDEWLAAQPIYVERLKREWKSIRQSDALREAAAERESLQLALGEAQTERDTLRTQTESLLAALTQARRGLALTEKLARLPLPAPWRVDLHAALLDTEPDEWDARIDAELSKARLVGATPRVAVNDAPAQIDPDAPDTAPAFAPRPDEDALAWWARTQPKKD